MIILVPATKPVVWMDLSKGREGVGGGKATQVEFKR